MLRSRNKIPRKEHIFREASRCPSGTQALSCRRECKCSWTCLQSHPFRASHLQPGQGVTAGGQSLRQGPDIAHGSEERTILTCPQEADGESRHTAHHPGAPVGSNTSGKKPSAHCLAPIPAFQQKTGGPLTAQQAPLPGSLPDTEPKNTDAQAASPSGPCFSGTEANPWLHIPGRDWRGDSVIEVRAPHTPTRITAEKMYHLYS